VARLAAGSELQCLCTMREEARWLIKQAERYLVNARENIGIEAYELAAFVAQQAVEKFLKAAWIVTRSRESPRTYSLIELGLHHGP